MANTSGGVSVTYADLMTLAGQLNNLLGMIQQQVTQMQGAVKNVAGVSWTGQTATQYNLLQDNWNKSLNQLIQSGSQLANFLTKAAPAYQDTDVGLARGLGNG